MRIRRTALAAALLALLAVAAVLVAGAFVPGGASPARAADPVVLTVKNAGTVVKTYTLDQLKALTPYTGFAGFMTTGGTVTGPEPITGVSLVTVMQDAGIDFTASQSVNLLAPDGYAANLTYDQVANANGFEIFDATTGKAEAAATTLTSVLVYERSGAALPPFDQHTGLGEGPLRFYVAQTTNTNQVMEGSVSTKGVTVFDVLAQPITEWDLKLVGLKIKGTRQIVTETRNSIEGCATPNCHKSGWTVGGQSWTGVPLWRLMGVVDGGTRHKGHSYNARLARAGYRIRFFDEAGHYTTISSKGTPYRNSIVVADLVDGVIPGTSLYPLRLIGPAKYVPASKRLGGIVKITMLPW